MIAGHASPSPATRQALLRALFAITFLLVLVWPNEARAALTFELRTGNSTTNTQGIPVDSNKCGTDGPTAAYVGGKITNTGSSDVTGITASMSGLNANFFLAGGQSASQAAGTLASGQSVNVFWFVGVSCSIGSTATPSIQISSSLGTQNTTVNLNIFGAISANAGGALSSGTLGPGAVVGQTIYFDAAYTFGGSDTGDVFLFQPTGSQLFNASCFRLVGTLVTASNVNAAPVGTTDWLYRLQPNKQTGTGYSVTVRYSFQYLCAATSTVARPYAQQTSGTQIKYTGNYDGSGSVQISFPGATNPFTISKTVSESTAFVGASGNLTYTITISNPSTIASIVSSISDVLPTGMSYVGLTGSSTVQASNSSSLPATGATGSLTFTGRLDQSYAIAAGGSVTLQYTASRPADPGSFTNSAQAHFGLASSPVAQSTYEQVAVTPLSVTKVSSIVSDPVNGAVSPFAIPGAVVEYLIVVSNPNPAAIDGNSLAIADIVPGDTKMCLSDLGGSGTGPVAFVDGGTSSTLAYEFLALDDAADDLEFSNDGGSDWNYEPTSDSEGCDSAITNFRIRPNGAFAPDASFSLLARFLIK